MKKKKSYSYKLVIGLILGVILSGTLVYASTYIGSGRDLTYDNTKLADNWLISTNAEDALKELQKQKGCPIGYSCINKKTTLFPGDYISYTPSSASYTTATISTGYTSTQTINPSELNLWRVLSINNDGTVDIISEDVSSVNVYFNGETGYRNLVEYLNELASQYENPAYTVGSRHFGYNGQTEYITTSAAPSATYFSTTPPWACSTGSTSSSCNPKPQDNEEYGGGDTLYESDYNLVNTVLGTRVANKVGTSTAIVYWMASRYYYYSSATSYSWRGRGVDISGSNTTSSLYYYSSSGLSTLSSGFALRPIVTLKPGLSYYGLGTKEYPMEIVGVQKFTGTKYTVNILDDENNWTTSNPDLVWIDNPIPSGVTLYDTPATARAAFSNRPFYLKHTIANDIVTESYVEFVVTPEMASANPGMTAGTYTLRGDNLYNYNPTNDNWLCKPENIESGTGNCRQSTYYTNNLLSLKQAFGENSGYCEFHDSGDEINAMCEVSGLGVVINAVGIVNIFDGSTTYASCLLYQDGSSHCYEE